MTIETLESVQRRREFPTRFTQRLQLVLQNNIIGPALEGRRPEAAVLYENASVAATAPHPGSPASAWHKTGTYPYARYYASDTQ